MEWSRVFSMPSPDTFSMLPLANLIDRWTIKEGRTRCANIIDPFARDNKIATHTNDLNPNTSAQFHMDAVEWLLTLPDQLANVVLFDPPYSPRQISECYQQVGRPCGMRDTQNARLYKSVKDQLNRILRSGGVAICCGWNSMGFGISRDYELLEVLLIPHGAAHNDTIVTVERKH